MTGFCEVLIIDCHKRGNMEKAINGKNVGTIIRAEKLFSKKKHGRHCRVPLFN